MNNFWDNLEIQKCDLILHLSEDPDFRLPSFLNEILNIELDADRVTLVYDNLEKHNLFTTYSKDEKNDEEALAHRTHGNMYFKDGNYRLAFHEYNFSLSMAKTNIEKALAYGNRSACLYNFGEFLECIKDIDRALTHGFPTNKARKLYERKARCEQFAQSASFKKKQSNQIYFYPIETIPLKQRNALIEAATDRIRLEHGHSVFGTHAVAARDIKIGEILSVEHPFQFHSIDVHEYFTKSNCDFCFAKCYSLIPCDSCTSMFYCSDQCKLRASEGVHKYECPIVKTISPDHIHRDNVLALKVVLSLRESLVGVEQNESEKELRNLETNYAKKTADEILAFAILTANFYHLIKKHTGFFTNAEHLEGPFKSSLFYYLMVCRSNALEIFEDQKAIGIGIYPFSSRYNHSCTPNVRYIYHGTAAVARATKTIKQGEQCFISYLINDDYTIFPKRERQDILMKLFNFSCRCPACVNDWNVSLLSAPCAKHPIPNSIREVTFGRHTAKQDLLKVARFVEQFQYYEPCDSYLILQYILMKCFHNFGNYSWINL